MELTNESWFCPNCGQPAEAKVGPLRLIECRPCRWVFDVRLYGFIESIEDGQVKLRQLRPSFSPLGTRQGIHSDRG